jgi:hypothetical protein
MALGFLRRQKSIGAGWKGTLDATQARAQVNRFLLSQIGTSFVLHEKWCVPILLVTPGFVAGQVGEATINLNTGELQDHTDTEQSRSIFQPAN